MTPLEATERWLERAVIGLELCPFAKAVHHKRQIRWVESAASDAESLLADLVGELRLLAAADPEVIDTTLIVHPLTLQDFDAFNDFLDVADAALAALGLEGSIQVASFHPGYRFEGSADGEMGDFSNRSPYPTLHLLREDSVSRALAGFALAEHIGERNVETLRRLGLAGWQALWRDA
jgi:uncharacterized protein